MADTSLSPHTRPECKEDRPALASQSFSNTSWVVQVGRLQWWQAPSCCTESLPELQDVVLTSLFQIWALFIIHNHRETG